MKELFLDYAGMRPENHPTRKALAKLQTGDVLATVIRNDHVELSNSAGVTVARLAQNTKKKWGNSLDQIKEIRVVAMVRRYKTDIQDQDFSNRCYGENWELPIVEMKFKDGNSC